MAAIYTPMWPIDIEVTTTLYPVDVTDAMDISVDVAESSMGLIPSDELLNTFRMGDSTYIQKRWFYEAGPFDDYIENTFGMEDGTYIQKRWFLVDGPYDDYIENTFGMEDGSLINKLVEVDSPDEELQLSCVTNSASTMSAI